MPSFSRRTFLGLIPGILTSAQSPPRRQPYRVVVAGGHPGDPEYGCGGTIARYTNSCSEVTLLYLDGGEKVCPPPVDDPGSIVRVTEASKADWVGIRTRQAAPDVGSQHWVKMGKSFAFYFYEVSSGEDTQMFAPTDSVDINATEPVKKAACYAHASQAPDKFYALQTAVSRFRGIESGCRLAEGFARHQSSRAQLPV